MLGSDRSRDRAARIQRVAGDDPVIALLVGCISILGRIGCTGSDGDDAGRKQRSRQTYGDRHRFTHDMAHRFSVGAVAMGHEPHLGDVTTPALGGVTHEAPDRERRRARPRRAVEARLRSAESERNRQTDRAIEHDPIALAAQGHAHVHQPNLSLGRSSHSSAVPCSRRAFVCSSNPADWMSVPGSASPSGNG